MIQELVILACRFTIICKNYTSHFCKLESKTYLGTIDEIRVQINNDRPLLSKIAHSRLSDRGCEYRNIKLSYVSVRDKGNGQPFTEPPLKGDLEIQISHSGQLEEMMESAVWSTIVEIRDKGIDVIPQGLISS